MIARAAAQYRELLFDRADTRNLWNDAAFQYKCGNSFVFELLNTRNWCSAGFRVSGFEKRQWCQHSPTLRCAPLVYREFADPLPSESWNSSPPGNRNG